MPLSNFWHLPTVLHFAQCIKPQRVLDVGIGTGTYGFHLRQLLDIASQRLRKEEWVSTIDGIEVFRGYSNPVWDYVYNNIIIGDSREIVHSLGSYDVAICNDMLEHLPIEDARKLVKELLFRCRILIATSPNRPFPQGAWAGNVAEAHLCQLQASDFSNLIAVKVNGLTSCYVCSRDKEAIRRIREATISCPTCGVRSIQYYLRPILGRIRSLLSNPRVAGD